jgi:hypothetical protein
MFRTKSLNFHIKSGDYFGTLATILNLLHQEEFVGDKDNILKEKVKELVYLQKNYKIMKKDGSKSSNKEH